MVNISRGIFITGIGTQVGKTIVSAILTEALKADYWKPIQAGNDDVTDSQMVSSLISNPSSRIHRERYSLKQPCSPHRAAFLENIEIKLDDFEVPESARLLVIEGAGGLLVPINNEHTMIDMIMALKVPVILVSKNYLGSINHTLLSIEALRKRDIPILGIVFNGSDNLENEKFIINKTALKVIGRLEDEQNFDRETVIKYANLFSEQLSEYC